MRFLRLLFLLFVALLAILFLGRNWSDVTVDLWGNMQADIKLPLLLVIAFLLGYLPCSILWRTRMWRLRRAQAPTPQSVQEERPASLRDGPAGAEQMQ